jgi:NAD(P)-dependent dehydrogenase (short-subunit alcohol dehydrogenase family)
MNAMLTGKVVVLTGGAGRLGSVFSRAIVETGGRVVIADLDNEHTAKAIGTLRAELGGKVQFVASDITDRDAVDALVAFCVAQHGRVDALVNNAYPRNANYGRRFEDVTYGDFVDNVGMHAGGYFLTAQRFMEHFKRQGHGNIVNMASIYGVVAPRFDVYAGTRMTMPVEYAVIKSGIIHLTKYIASYCAGLNIRCNAISPGGILAGQPQEFLDRYKEHALSKGMLNEQDVCGTLLYLLSDLSSYINGQNIVVDDGWSL